jgi:hypothetical protein
VCHLEKGYTRDLRLEGNGVPGIGKKTINMISLVVTWKQFSPAQKDAQTSRSDLPQQMAEWIKRRRIRGSLVGKYEA